MKQQTVKFLSAALVLFAVLACASSPDKIGGVNLMRIDQLNAQLDDPETLILDVRTGKDWTSSNQKIKGAERVETLQFRQWADKYPKEKTVVFYCAWPNEITSVRMALKLMKRGYPSVYALKGGWDAWLAAKYPVEAK